MNELTDEDLARKCGEMSHDEWLKLLARLKEIDPGFFDVLKGIVHEGILTGPVSGVSVADPPRHETGTLAKPTQVP